MKVDGVIFDYGGTIDSHGDHWSEVIWRAYCHCGVEVSKEAFRDAYVFAERALAKTKYIFPEHNFLDLLRIKMQLELGNLAEGGFISTDEAQRKVEPVAQYCYDAARRSVEDARPVLEALYKQLPMVLVSNFYGNVESVLADFDLLRYFRQIVESAVVGVRKPDPRIFELGVKALGLSAENVLVVGDSYKKDIIPAESIGCQTLWLKGKGWTPEEDAQQHPRIIASLNDVLEYVKRANDEV